MRPRSSPPTWLIGISLGAIIVTLAYPRTGWIAREQWTAVLTGGQTPAAIICGSDDKSNQARVFHAYSAVANKHPNDLQIQLAFAVSPNPSDAKSFQGPEDPRRDPRLVRLRNLAPRFSRDTAYWATKLRIVTIYGNGILEDDRVLGVNQAPPLKPKDVIDFAHNDQVIGESNAIIGDAAAGERLDPNNVYFPFLKARGYFSLNRIPEALAAVEDAGTKFDWNDYAYDEALGDIRLQQVAFGDHSAISGSYVLSAITYPEFGTVRAIARASTIQAIEHEQAGDYATGILIRESLLRCGDAMRIHGRTVIENLVGIAIEQIAITRPGAIMDPPRPAGNPTSEAAWRAYEAAQRARSVKMVDAYANYLSVHGQGDESRWERGELLAGLQQRDDLSKVSIDRIYAPYSWTAISWTVGLLLAGIAVIALFATICVSILIALGGENAGPSVAPESLRGAALGAIIASVVYAGICMWLPFALDDTGIQLFWHCVLAAVPALAIITVVVLGVPECRDRKLSPWKPIFVTLGLVVLASLVISAATSPARGYFGFAVPTAFMNYARWLITMEYRDTLITYDQMGAYCVAVVFGALLLVVLTAGLISWRKHPKGVVRRVQLLAASTAAIFAVASCVSIAVTSSYEAQAHVLINSQTQSEYELWAKFSGMAIAPSPSPPPSPKM